MAHTVQLIIDVTIDEGKLTAFEEIAQAMIVETQKEPGTLAYDWYLSDDRKRRRRLVAWPPAERHPTRR